MGPTLYGVGSIIFLQENYPPQTPTGGMDEFEERRLKAGGGERCWKKLPGGPSNHPQNPMKNEGFKVLMPKDMGYNPQKMKVWWGSRGCKTSSDNVASLQGIVFFHFVVAGFCSSSQNVHFLSVSFGFFYGDDLRSRRICLRCTREVWP